MGSLHIPVLTGFKTFIPVEFCTSLLSKVEYLRRFVQVGGLDFHMSQGLMNKITLAFVEFLNSTQLKVKITLVNMY